ncbi:hypothetical protein Tco_1554491 [Tanacetum coccineum]
MNPILVSSKKTSEIYRRHYIVRHAISMDIAGVIYSWAANEQAQAFEGERRERAGLSWDGGRAGRVSRGLATRRSGIGGGGERVKGEREAQGGGGSGSTRGPVNHKSVAVDLRREGRPGVLTSPELDCRRGADVGVRGGWMGTGLREDLMVGVLEEFSVGRGWLRGCTHGDPDGPVAA